LWWWCFHSLCVSTSRREFYSTVNSDTDTTSSMITLLLSCNLFHTWFGERRTLSQKCWEEKECTPLFPSRISSKKNKKNWHDMTGLTWRLKRTPLSQEEPFLRQISLLWRHE
jgi:hypothetical protein